MAKPKTSARRVILCALMLAATRTAAAQERAPSLEQTLAMMFDCSPAFHISSARTRRAEAGHLRSSGAFDVVTSAGVQGQRSLLSNTAGLMTDASYSDLAVSVGIGGLTRANIGLQLTGSMPLVSTIDPILSPYQPLVSASVTVPLLKLGRSAAFGAEERASGLHADAALASQQESESELASRVAQAYWRWVASRQQLELMRSLEELALDQLRDVDQLIAQHARAAADRLAIVAAAENAAATRVQAEQTMFAQQELLWETLGLPPPTMHLVPDRELPRVPSPIDAGPVAERAHARATARPLFKSLADETAALAVRAEAARIGKRPDVNFVAQASATRVLSAAWDPQSSTAPDQRLGYYGAVALQLALPLPNRAARGALEEANAAHAEAQLSVEQQRNAIGARIDALSGALASVTRTYQQRMSAAKQFRLAYDAQRTRFRLGTATAMDVVIAEQQYMSASLSTVSDAMEYALALARLQHEAGALNQVVRARDAAATARALTNPTL
jgi:outer membrane protein TolC